MRARPLPTTAPGRPVTVQPSVAANGACWRRQAMSVVTTPNTHKTAADSPGAGREPCGDGRFPLQDKN